MMNRWEALVLEIFFLCFLAALFYLIQRRRIHLHADRERVSIAVELIEQTHQYIIQNPNHQEQLAPWLHELQKLEAQQQNSLSKASLQAFYQVVPQEHDLAKRVAFYQELLETK